MTLEQILSLLRICFCSVFREASFWAITLVMVVTSQIVGGYVEGAETGIPIHDLIEVGVFKGKKNSEEPLHTEKVPITEPRTTLGFIVNEPPTRAAIDPDSKLIDRNPEETWADVDETLKLSASYAGEFFPVSYSGRRRTCGAHVVLR